MKVALAFVLSFSLTIFTGLVLLRQGLFGLAGLPW